MRKERAGSLAASPQGVDMGGSEQKASIDPAQVYRTLTAVFSADSGAPVLLPYQFHMEEIEGFRYRCRVSGALWGCGYLGLL